MSRAVMRIPALPDVASMRTRFDELLDELGADRADWAPRILRIKPKATGLLVTEHGRLGPAKRPPSEELAKRRNLLDPAKAELARLARQLRTSKRRKRKPEGGDAP